MKQNKHWELIKLHHKYGLKIANENNDIINFPTWLEDVYYQLLIPKDQHGNRIEVGKTYERYGKLQKIYYEDGDAVFNNMGYSFSCLYDNLILEEETNWMNQSPWNKYIFYIIEERNEKLYFDNKRVDKAPGYADFAGFAGGDKPDELHPTPTREFFTESDVTPTAEYVVFRR